MSRFARNGVFLATTDYTPPDLRYTVQTRNTTRRFHVLSCHNGVVRYPIAIGREIIGAITPSTTNTQTPACTMKLMYFSPQPKAIPYATITAALSSNQQLALDALVLPPRYMGTEYTGVPEYTTTPALTNAIVRLDTGQGKTRLMAHTINNIGKKALVVVPRKTLLAQTAREFADLYGSAISIGQYSSACKLDGDVLVITNKSLMNAVTGGFSFAKPIAFREYMAAVGTVCYDEIHMYCSEKTWGLFDIGADHMIGFSATPEQSAHIRRAELAVGRVINVAALPGYSTALCEFKLNVTFLNYNTKTKIEARTKRVGGEDMLDYHHTMTQIRRDQDRVDRITHFLHGLPTQMVIIVFSTERAYAQKLLDAYAPPQLYPHASAHLADADEFTACSALPVTCAITNMRMTNPVLHDGVYYERRNLINTLAQNNDTTCIADTDTVFCRYLKHTSGADIRGGACILMGGGCSAASAKKQAEILAMVGNPIRVVFTTYDFLSTGVSISQANAICIAEPRNANGHQRVGRIMRIDGDRADRHVFDIVDCRTPLRHQYKKRIDTYNTRSAQYTTRPLC